MTSKGYRELHVWQEAIELVELIYSVSKNFPKQETYGLTNQMQRCAVSIPSNIAEGHGRRSKKEFRRFLYFSMSSLAELDTQLEIAKRLRYLKPEDGSILDKKIEQIRKMLYGLINKSSKKRDSFSLTTDNRQLEFICPPKSPCLKWEKASPTPP